MTSYATVSAAASASSTAVIVCVDMIWTAKINAAGPSSLSRTDKAGVATAVRQTFVIKNRVATKFVHNVHMKCFGTTYRQVANVNDTVTAGDR